MNKEINIETINKLLRIDGKAIKALDVLSSQPKEHLVMILTHVIDYLEEQREENKLHSLKEKSGLLVDENDKQIYPLEKEDWEETLHEMFDDYEVDGQKMSEMTLYPKVKEFIASQISKAKTDERERNKGIINNETKHFEELTAPFWETFWCYTIGHNFWIDFLKNEATCQRCNKITKNLEDCIQI